MQFTQIPESLGPNGGEAEISVQITTSEKEVAEKKSAANLIRTMPFLSTIAY